MYRMSTCTEIMSEKQKLQLLIVKYSFSGSTSEKSCRKSLKMKRERTEEENKCHRASQNKHYTLKK